MQEKVTRLKAECIACLANRYMKKVPEQAEESARMAYLQGVAGILHQANPEMSAPEIVEQINTLRISLFGCVEEYREVKCHFNALMLEQEEQLREQIRLAEDPLGLAVRYAMLGNYIDFGAMAQVDEQVLLTQLEQAKEMPLPQAEYENLRQDLAGAHRLVYLTDNCGEIVLDKLLLECIREQYPTLQVEVILRGAPVLNDATREDARQVGLDQVAAVSDNGTAIAGTCLHRIRPEALEKIEAADLVIAKGQGNFETMWQCGRNVYYLFLCKCGMFAHRFRVPLYTGMLVNDRRL